MNHINHKKTTLGNGLRLITVPMAGTDTVTVVVMVGVGSRYEKDSEAGLSHFIEHMFFKGTQKRPTTLDISAELDAVGGEYNAFTGKDKTGYYAKVDSKHIGTAMDVVFDMFLNSKIEEKEIKREKGTIIQELNMYEDTPMRNVGDEFESLLYPGNPLGRYIVGTKKTVRSFKRKDFVDYMDKFYRANDTIVCVAGKMDEKKVIEKAKEHFKSMARGLKPKLVPAAEKQTAPALRIKYKNTDQSHLIVGVRAYDQNHKDRFALSLLSVILGANMSSRLFIEVRERRGLAYYVRSGVEAFEDCGYFETQAGVEHKNLELALATILAEYAKIAREKVSEEELKKAKEYIKGKSIMGLEASDEVAMFYVDQEMERKKIMTIEEIFAKIDKVSVDDILRVAGDIFQNRKLNLAVIGPHRNGQRLKKLLKI